MEYFTTPNSELIVAWSKSLELALLLARDWYCTTKRYITFGMEVYNHTQRGLECLHKMDGCFHNSQCVGRQEVRSYYCSLWPHCGYYNTYLELKGYASLSLLRTREWVGKEVSLGEKYLSAWPANCWRQLHSSTLARNTSWDNYVHLCLSVGLLSSPFTLFIYPFIILLKCGGHCGSNCCIPFSCAIIWSLSNLMALYILDTSMTHTIMFSPALILGHILLLN